MLISYMNLSHLLSFMSIHLPICSFLNHMPTSICTPVSWSVYTILHMSVRLSIYSTACLSPSFSFNYSQPKIRKLFWNCKTSKWHRHTKHGSFKAKLYNPTLIYLHSSYFIKLPSLPSYHIFLFSNFTRFSWNHVVTSFLIPPASCRNTLKHCEKDI